MAKSCYPRTSSPVFTEGPILEEMAAALGAMLVRLEEKLPVSPGCAGSFSLVKSSRPSTEFRECCRCGGKCAAGDQREVNVAKIIEETILGTICRSERLVLSVVSTELRYIELWGWSSAVC